MIMRKFYPLSTISAIAYILNNHAQFLLNKQNQYHIILIDNKTIRYTKTKTYNKREKQTTQT